MLGTPLEENSIRIESDTGTSSTAAPKRSGRSVIARPTKMPPALPPMIAIFGAEVYLCATSHSPQAMASSHVLCLVVL
jgi:hypothetical protein